MFIGKGNAPTCPLPHPQPREGDLAEGSRALTRFLGGRGKTRGCLLVPSESTFQRRDERRPQCAAVAALKSKQVNRLVPGLLAFKGSKLRPEEVFVCGLSLLFASVAEACSARPPPFAPHFAFLFLREQRASSVCLDNDSYKCIYSK